MPEILCLGEEFLLNPVKSIDESKELKKLESIVNFLIKRWSLI